LRRLPRLFALSPVLLVLAALVLWRLSLSPPPPQTIEASVGGQRLHFAAAYLREGQPDADRVELLVTAPDLAPAGDPRSIPGDALQSVKRRASLDGFWAAGAALIFITFALAAPETGVSAPADRYGPYLEPDVQMSEAGVNERGLIHRRFEEKSPFSGEDFYYSAPDGQAFSARCQRPRIPADGLPDICLAHVIVEGLDLTLRFNPLWLPQWSSLRANAQLLARGALAP
jgi:hypothetical protein